MTNLYSPIGKNLNRVSRKIRFLFFILLSLSLWPQAAAANWSPLIERLVADGFDELGIRYLFSRPEVKFEPGAMSSKLEALIKNQSKKPGEARRVSIESGIQRTPEGENDFPRPVPTSRKIGTFWKASAASTACPKRSSCPSAGGKPARRITGWEMGFQLLWPDGLVRGAWRPSVLISPKSWSHRRMKSMPGLGLPAESRLGLFGKASSPHSCIALTVVSIP